VTSLFDRVALACYALWIAATWWLERALARLGVGA
jgi:hypothetical protein